MTSATKDWSDTVQVDDVSTSNGGSGSCSKYDVSSLLADAPLDSIRQKINVEREEEVVEGPLPTNEEALLNTDVVSEKVDLDLIGGQVSSRRLSLCRTKFSQMICICQEYGIMIDGAALL
jgi:hypothetical protein